MPELLGPVPHRVGQEDRSAEPRATSREEFAPSGSHFGDAGFGLRDWFGYNGKRLAATEVCRARASRTKTSPPSLNDGYRQPAVSARSVAVSTLQSATDALLVSEEEPVTQ